MSKRPKQDIIIFSIIILIGVLYLAGTPKTLLINLVMVGLLVAAIAYILFHSAVGIYQSVRGVIEFKRVVALKKSPELIDTMPWEEFEVFVAQWLKGQGYEEVRLTEHYDLGIDIIAEKDGARWGIQVKHYHTPVSIDAIRQAVVALKHYKCDKAMVVTNSFFTYPAKRLAKSNECRLVEGKELRLAKTLETRQYDAN